MARRHKDFKEENISVEITEDSPVTLPVFPDEEIEEFKPETVKVYGFVNEFNHLVELKSSIFHNATETDMIIDEGFGDNYVHIGEYLNNVLGNHLYDNDDCANYKIESISTLEVDAVVRYMVIERSQEEKQIEIDARPIPPTPPNLNDVAETVKSLSLDSETLYEAVFDVDNKALAIGTSVAQQTLDIETTMEAIIDVDTKAIKAGEAVVEQTTDIQVIMEAIVEMDSKLRAVIEHLGIQIN